jgi:hypothetical protein
MTQIENMDVLILRPSDIIERFQSEFDVTNLKGFIKYFNFDTHESVLTSSLILFIDDDGNTAILKNRYGKAQI